MVFHARGYVEREVTVLIFLEKVIASCTEVLKQMLIIVHVKVDGGFNNCFKTE